MLSNEVCPFSHEGSREVVNDPKKVDESRTLVRLVSINASIPDLQGQNEQFPNSSHIGQSNLPCLLLIGHLSKLQFLGRVERSAG